MLTWTTTGTPVPQRDYLTIQYPDDLPPQWSGRVWIGPLDLVYCDPAASLDDATLAGVELVETGFQCIINADVVKGMVIPPDIKLLGPVVGVHKLYWFTNDRPTDDD